jgi:hypothetical protein
MLAPQQGVLFCTSIRMTHVSVAGKTGRLVESRARDIANSKFKEAGTEPDQASPANSMKRSAS